ncbi:hypothetical protein GCM10028790_12280 [Micromonospora taraxaci]
MAMPLRDGAVFPAVAATEGLGSGARSGKVLMRLRVLALDRSHLASGHRTLIHTVAQACQGSCGRASRPQRCDLPEMYGDALLMMGIRWPEQMSEWWVSSRRWWRWRG